MVLHYHNYLNSMCTIIWLDIKFYEININTLRCINDKLAVLCTFSLYAITGTSYIQKAEFPVLPWKVGGKVVIIIITSVLLGLLRPAIYN